MVLDADAFIVSPLLASTRSNGSDNEIVCRSLLFCGWQLLGGWAVGFVRSVCCWYWLDDQFIDGE